MSRSGSEDTARTCALAGLTLGNLLLVAVDATASQGLRALLTRDFPAFWIVALAAASVIAAAIAWPPLRALMHFGVPPVLDLALSLAACAAAVLFPGPLVHTSTTWLRPAHPPRAHAASP